MKMIVLLYALVCLSAATDDVRARFREAMDKYAVQDQINLSESPEVLKARLQSFMEFDARVQEINADDSRLFTAEDNFLSILTPEERAGRLGLNITGHEEEESTGLLTTPNVGDYPSQRDFSGVISDVKDQGGCGSCWTFGAATALEGEIYFKTGDRKVSISEQEWLECSSRGDGCRGGWPQWCYEYSRKSGRVAPTSAYRYRNSDRGCSPQTMQRTANALTDHNVLIAGDIRIRKGSLLRYASEHIISVAIYVNSDFQAYRKGVYMDDSCQRAPNHAVGVVGYGTLYNRPYWKVRNSWGNRWGDGGYILMDRQRYDMCKIESYAHYPDVRCRDKSCVAPKPDDGDSDDGGEEGTKEPPKICYKTLNLGYSRNSRSRALNDCKNSGIPEKKCYIVKYWSSSWNYRGYWYMGSVSATSTSRTSSQVRFPVPCDEDNTSLCKKSLKLSWCSYSADAALKACADSGIPQRKCLFVRWSDFCYSPSVAKGGMQSYIEYYSSCEEDDSSGECDAAAGMVMCSDCNCCKHKHWCHD